MVKTYITHDGNKKYVQKFSPRTLKDTTWDGDINTEIVLRVWIGFSCLKIRSNVVL